jgi:D-aspartate ligase
MSFGARLDGWIATIGDAADDPPAVVMGGSANALSHIRSLGRRGVPTAVLDHRARLARYSRYATALDASTGRDGRTDLLSALEAIGPRLPQPAVLLPTADGHVELLAREAARLSSWFRFLVPDADTVDAIVDKATQYARASDAGIPTPVTFFPTSLDELRDIAARAPFPCLLKPVSVGARDVFGAKARIVADPTELARVYAERASKDVRFVVQEWIPGPDTDLYGYLAFWDADGREHSWMTKRKERQYPLGLGTGATQISVEAPEVAEQSRRLLTSFGWKGLVGVEWKRDERDGRFLLMEINPRTVIGNQLAISAGVDLPWIAYCSLREPPQPVAPTSTFRVGVQWVNEDLDPKAYRDLRREGRLTTGQWLRSLSRTRSWALWSWRDPMPLAMRFLGPVARHLPGRRRGRRPRDRSPGWRPGHGCADGQPSGTTIGETTEVAYSVGGAELVTSSIHTEGTTVSGE